MATNHPPSVPQKSSQEKTWANWMHDDIIEEIHAHRAALSERFHGNLDELLRYYQSLDIPVRVSSDKPQQRRMPSTK